MSVLRLELVLLDFASSMASIIYWHRNNSSSSVIVSKSYSCCSTTSRVRLVLSETLDGAVSYHGSNTDDAFADSLSRLYCDKIKKPHIKPIL